MVRSTCSVHIQKLWFEGGNFCSISFAPGRPEINHLVVSNNTCVMGQKIMFAVVIFRLSWSTFGHRSPLIVLVFLSVTDR